MIPCECTHSSGRRASAQSVRWPDDSSSSSTTTTTHHGRASVKRRCAKNLATLRSLLVSSRWMVSYLTKKNKTKMREKTDENENGVWIDRIKRARAQAATTTDRAQLCQCVGWKGENTRSIITPSHTGACACPGQPLNHVCTGCSGRYGQNVLLGKAVLEAVGERAVDEAQLLTEQAEELGVPATKRKTRHTHKVRQRRTRTPTAQTTRTTDNTSQPDKTARTSC